jgi:HEPN domain-containing protein
MYSQIHSTLLHLRQAVSHLHNAKLIIEAIDKAASHSIEQLIRAARDQIKHLEQLSSEKL